MEYQDLLGRPVWGDVATADERHEVLAALARQGRWPSWPTIFGICAAAPCHRHKWSRHRLSAKS